MKWYKVHFPPTEESLKSIDAIRQRFRQISLQLIAHDLYGERTSLFQNRNSVEDYIIYFSPTSEVALLNLIKEYNGELCEEPSSKTISLLVGDNEFWEHLL